MNAQPSEQAYNIEFSDEAGILCLTFNGFWTAPIVDRFKADIIDTVKGLSVTHRTFHTLIDQRGFSVQSLDTVHTLNDIFTATGRIHTGRIAVVSSSVLSKLKVGRKLDDPRVKVFGDLGSARTWLISD